MPRALHLRLALLLAVILIPAGALAIAMALRSARTYHQEITQRTDIDLAANLVAELGPDARLPSDPTPDAGAWGDLVKMLAMSNPGVEIYVLAEDGDVVQAPAAVTPDVSSVDLGPVHEFLDAQAGAAHSFPILGTDPRRGGRTVFSAAQLEGGGILYVVLTDETRASLARSVRTSTSLRLIAWGGGLGLAVLLGVGVLAFSLLTRRLRRLNTAMRRFQADESTGPIEQRDTIASGRTGDEIDELSHDFEELTARVRAQVRALEHADAARRDLVTNVSHDLRTPLTAVRGSLEALETQTGQDAEPSLRANLDVARRNADHLERLIDHLFELSRLDGPDPPMRPERFALAELVYDVVAEYAGRAEAAGVRLEATQPPDLPLLRGDLGQIERALSNVLDNALRHTAAGGAVRVSMAAAVDSARIRVEDEGVGIPLEHQAHVFERFYRVAPGRGGSGSGLGLAIARRIVELHGGSIELVSTPGEGTTVTLAFPLAGPTRRPSEPHDFGA